MAIDFGVMYEITVPKPWHPRSDFDAYMAVVDQVVLAEELGYTYFWTVEHHRLPEFSQSPAPGLLFGYVAARTSKIRIGHGVYPLPFVTAFQ